jgi:hypothetical protein
MQLDRKEIEAALARKGFRLEVRDHRFYWLYVDGKQTGIYTYVSTSPKYKTIQAHLIAKMARQLHLSKSEFVELIQCPMDGPRYVSRLRDQGLQV